MKTNYNYMTEDEKILNILDLMGAVSPETAVTTEQMIDRAIEEGATKDIFTDGWHGHNYSAYSKIGNSYVSTCNHCGKKNVLTLMNDTRLFHD